MPSQMKEVYFLVARKTWDAPHTYFGPFADPDTAEQFVDQFLPSAGLIRAFVPEQFDGLDRLPEDTWS